MINFNDDIITTECSAEDIVRFFEDSNLTGSCEFDDGVLILKTGNVHLYFRNKRFFVFDTKEGYEKAIRFFEDGYYHMNYREDVENGLSTTVFDMSDNYTTVLAY